MTYPLIRLPQNLSLKKHTGVLANLKIGRPLARFIPQNGRGEIQADNINFELNGEQFTGWLGGCPFKNGDEVEVAAQEVEPGKHVVYGLARPKDRLITLFPFAKASVPCMWFNFIKWFLMLMLFFMIGMLGFMSVADFFQSKKSPFATIIGILTEMIWVVSYGLGIFLWKLKFRRWLAPFLMTWAFVFLFWNNKALILQIDFIKGYWISFIIISLVFLPFAFWYLPFARLSEQVFSCLGFPNPRWINLPRRSKKHRINFREIGVCPTGYIYDEDGAEKLAKDPSYNYGNPLDPLTEMDYGSKFFRY